MRAASVIFSLCLLASGCSCSGVTTSNDAALLDGGRDGGTTLDAPAGDGGLDGGARIDAAADAAPADAAVADAVLADAAPVDAGGGDDGAAAADAGPCAADADADDDGHDRLACGGDDCDDDDPTVSPAAPELPYDGADNDCSASTPDDDLDSDGAPIATDCDDDDPTRHPGALEVCNRVDDDCDGAADDGVLGDSTCSGLGCVAIAAAGRGDGVYSIDPDDAGPAAPYDAYCLNSIAGGGWQLVSSRLSASGGLFADAVCTDPMTTCSGSIPAPQVRLGPGPDVLLMALDRSRWIQLTGVGGPGADGLLDRMRLAQPLIDSPSCTAPHYCGITPDTELRVAASSAGYVPRFTTLRAQFARHGGIWFGDGGSGVESHVVSLNYSYYCVPGGLDLSDARDATLGNVACGVPGAIFFRY